MLPEGRIDVSLHTLVPAHEVLPKAEVENVLAKFGLRKEQLPKIKLNDPQAKRLGAKVGDIVKITRKDIVGENLYFRLVVK